MPLTLPITRPHVLVAWFVDDEECLLPRNGSDDISVSSIIVSMPPINDIVTPCLWQAVS